MNRGILNEAGERKMDILKGVVPKRMREREEEAKKKVKKK